MHKLYECLAICISYDCMIDHPNEWISDDGKLYMMLFGWGSGVYCENDRADISL